MTIRSLAEDTASKARAAIATPLTEQEQEAVIKVIEGAIIEAIRNTMQECQDAAVRCTGEAQLKKKMVIEINRSATARFPDMGSTR